MLLLCSIAFVTTPASADPAARTELSVREQTSGVEFTDMSARRRDHRATRRHALRGLDRHARVRRTVSASNAFAIAPDQHGVGATPARGVGAARSNAGAQSDVGSGLVAEARRYVGGNPTGRSRLWCAHFMNFVLERSGHQGSGSGFARSFASYGQRVSGPQVGAIAVMSRGRGGHVGVVSGVDAAGNPIIISGNHGGRVAETVYPRGRIYAYVMP
jgi:uncharacterized protein (TIGR02594 family)